jgi:hypothetical protein
VLVSVLIRQAPDGKRSRIWQKPSYRNYLQLRSIDYYLRVCLRNFYDVDANAAAEALKNLQIIHLHGQLGDLNQNRYGSDGNDEVERIKRARAGIKIIHEVSDAENDPEFVKARMAIKECERLVILGFAFAPENLMRLKLYQISPRGVFASGYGITDSEKQDVAALVRLDTQILWVGRNEPILSFLRESGALPKSQS